MVKFFRCLFFYLGKRKFLKYPQHFQKIIVEYTFSYKGGFYVWVGITVLMGVTGGLTAIKLKIPAGAIIGSMFAVVAFNILTGKAVFPQETRILLQIGTGAYIGSRIYKKDVIELKNIITPTIILTVTMCLYNI